MITGGSFYPSHYNAVGVSVRDKIAIEAMKAILSSPHCSRQINNEVLADQCYSLADSMIERSKK